MTLRLTSKEKANAFFLTPVYCRREGNAPTAEAYATCILHWRRDSPRRDLLRPAAKRGAPLHWPRVAPPRRVARHRISPLAATEMKRRHLPPVLVLLALSLLALPYRRHGRRTPRTAAMPGRQRRRRRQTRGGDGRPEEEEARRGRGQRRPSASPWTPPCELAADRPPRAVPSAARLPRPGPRATESRAVQRRPSAYDAEPRGPLPPCPRPAAVHAVARSGRAGLLRRRRRREGGGPRIRPPAPTERRRRRTARWGRKWRAGAGRGKGEEGGEAERSRKGRRGEAELATAPRPHARHGRREGGAELICIRFVGDEIF